MTRSRRRRQSGAVPPAQSPTVRRRRLARRLIELREAAGLTAAQVAGELEWATTTLYRIESAERGTSAGNVSLMLELYASRGAAVSDAERTGLVQLARDARKRGWWVGYGLDESFALYVGLEAETASIDTYLIELIPGLLQTEAYAREILRTGLPAPTPEELDRWTAVRSQRQRRLTEADPLRLWAVLSEAAVRRWPRGRPEIMTEQLESLVAQADRPNVTLQVLPFEVGFHSAMDYPFTIMGFPDRADPDVVYLESATSNLYLEEPADVEVFKLAFDHLRAAALDPGASVAMIENILIERGSR